jgi:hypothetical protein
MRYGPKKDGEHLLGLNAKALIDEVRSSDGTSLINVYRLSMVPPDMPPSTSMADTQLSRVASGDFSFRVLLER